MAYYKVGDRILSSEEWDDEVFFRYDDFVLWPLLEELVVGRL